MIYYIVDDIPLELGGPSLVSFHRSLAEANFMLIYHKGHSGTHYENQYMRIRPLKGDLSEVFKIMNFRRKCRFDVDWLLDNFLQIPSPEKPKRIRKNNLNKIKIKKLEDVIQKMKEGDSILQKMEITYNG